jgi:ribosomal protein L44E
MRRYINRHLQKCKNWLQYKVTTISDMYVSKSAFLGRKKRRQQTYIGGIIDAKIY